MTKDQNKKKKKVKRIQWNPPFDFRDLGPKKPPPRQDPAFLSQTRDQVVYLQRKESLAVPTSTKYRPRECQEKIGKGVVKLSDAPLNREKYQAFISPCVTSLDQSLVKKHQVKPEHFNLMEKFKNDE